MKKRFLVLPFHLLTPRELEQSLSAAYIEGFQMLFASTNTMLILENTQVLPNEMEALEQFMKQTMEVR